MREKLRRLMLRIPSYRSHFPGLSERPLLAFVFSLAMIAGLWTMLAVWSEAPQESSKNPAPRPRPKAQASPKTSEREKPQYANDPRQWTPSLPSYDNPEAYGTLPGYEASLKLQNSQSFGAGSLQRGGSLYQKNCASCHGARGEGKLQLQNPVRPLSNPRGYQYGNSDSAIFRSISFGVPSGSMGRFHGQLSEREIWDITNFIKSLWTVQP